MQSTNPSPSPFEAQARKILKDLYYTHRLKEGGVMPAKNSTDGKDHPVMIKTQTNMTLDQAFSALVKLHEAAVREAIEVHDIENHIEMLDIQCDEGNCKNCDRKRPKLIELQERLAQLRAQHSNKAKGDV